MPEGHRSALLRLIEGEAKTRKAPRILSGVSSAVPSALEGAQKHGYREIGRRIESYVDARTFDRAPFQGVVDRVKTSGIGLQTFAERVAGLDDTARDAFWRAL